MKKLITLLLCITSLLLAGCFQVERVVTVLPDGSGSYAETVMLSNKMVAMMQGLMGKEGDQTQKEFELTSPDELKKAAAGMGSGVSFVSSQKVRTDSFTGYRAIYSFKDINQLQMDSGPPNLDKKPQAAKPETAVRFHFTPGSIATLRVISPKARLKDSKPAELAKETKEPNPKELEQMKEVLDGMRVGFSVVIDGKIVETNATHRDGNRITMADLDFGKLLTLSPKEFAQLNTMKEGDFIAVMEVVKNLPGIKFDLNEELHVRFKE